MSRIFLPGQEGGRPGESRSTAILERVLSLREDELDRELEVARTAFDNRHRDLEGTWERHFALVEHRLAPSTRVPPNRRLLIGAYFTQEFAFEGAAIFNPSMVPHPDQTGLPEGSTRFLMTVRAVGEGHLSSIEFRTGTISSRGDLVLDPPADVAILPTPFSTRYSLADFKQQLADLGGAHTNADFVLDRLPDSFSGQDLDTALDDLRGQSLTRGAGARTVARLRRMAACTYSVQFPEDSAVQERVLMPTSPAESRGMEDVRLLRLTEPGASSRYVGTYTAQDDRGIASQLIETDDIRTFHITPLSGPGARNKGIAVFPRRIGGHFMALSRADRESNGITTSSDLRQWDEPVLIQTPDRPWEIVQLGNCGPPIETDEGWLVLTHGVGPMRQYGIGALLLSLEDPTIVLGRLESPLLTPAHDERDGYVPNVVYSCGAMLHGRTLVLPYGCSDARIRFALVDLDALLDALAREPLTKENR